jgi:pimeloyl-ACP methyl ester carboxylesterase
MVVYGRSASAHRPPAASTAASAPRTLGGRPRRYPRPGSFWSGEQDTDTPARHARWLATAIPGAELHLFPEEGHLSLVYGREWEVLDWLAQQLAVTADPKRPGRAQEP